jgi:hypothetical protein
MQLYKSNLLDLYKNNILLDLNNELNNLLFNK